MIGAATSDLVGGLTDLATYCAGEGAQSGIWILDSSGAVLARGGASELDGEPDFNFGENAVRITRVPGSRDHVHRRVDVSSSMRLWLVLTGPPGSSEGLEKHADFIVGMLSRAALRDYETDDTTEHLLALFEQVRSLHDLADQLPDCDSIEEMGQLGLKSLITAVCARVAGLALREDRSDQLKCILVSEGGSETRAMQIPLEGESNCPLMRAFVDGKVIYGGVESFDIPPDSILAEAEHCLMIVPICFGTKPHPEVLGCLIMFDRAESTGSGVPHFGNPEAELTESVGVLLGLILGTRQRVQAEKELQIASAIQETMIPARAPLWTGLDLAARNVTANQVGGDYFDFILGKSSTKHMIIADVSGHNMASAMAMVMARTQFKSVLEHINRPKEAMTSVAGGLFQDLVRNELFITCFLLTLDELSDEGASIRYTNAGHNPPLLLRADGTVTWLEGGGPMVGFMPSIDYDECDTLVRPGDVVVLYTDGVTEAADDAGNLLDEEGLVEIVRPLSARSSEEILSGIYDAVDEHTGSREASDDVTVMVLKVGVDGPHVTRRDEK